MLAKIKDILIIVNKGQLNQYKKLIPNGDNLRTKNYYLEQDKPVGLPDAFILGQKFIGKNNVALILGDNFFYGQSLSENLKNVLILKKEQQLCFIRYRIQNYLVLLKSNDKTKNKQSKRNQKNLYQIMLSQVYIFLITRLLIIQNH